MDSGLSWSYDLPDVYIRNFIPLGLSAKYQTLCAITIFCLNYQNVQVVQNAF